MEVRQEVFDSYWMTAAERQEIFFRKLSSGPTLLTQDPIYQSYKFCNVYRASDRVSQYLIKNVIYSNKYSDDDTVFRILFFRLLNRIETWQALEKVLGVVSLKNFNMIKYSTILEQVNLSQPIYGNAFILCANKAYGYDRKHENHLGLLGDIFKNKNNIGRLLGASSLKQLYGVLRSFPLLGNFMAYQMAIDLNYSEVFDFDENEFTVAGPGAKRGINKCFISTGGKNDEYIIQHMVNNQDKEFRRLDIDFMSLWGRPMKAIDCQGWFCETDKYCRVKFPGLKSNRWRIKTKYKPTNTIVDYFYPPKWGINKKITSPSYGRVVGTNRWLFQVHGGKNQAREYR